jgi:murein DD-endopeptidase MepM/ murein hydrolase activator NlpD
VQYRPELLRESDRYRGRRRAPTPPRSRYAAVLTTAFVGAGIVAFGAGAGLHDAKTDTLGSDNAALTDASRQRDLAADRPSRGEKTLNSSITKAPKDAWVLPVRGYHVTSLFGQRWGRLHAGIDLGGIKEGTPIYAMHDGKVIVANWQGGYGYAVFIQHEDGLVTVYGHNSKLYVKVGQEVKAGDQIAGAGNTGHSFGTHCHLEIRVNDVPTDPIKFFKAKGINFYYEYEAVYGDPMG